MQGCRVKVCLQPKAPIFPLICSEQTKLRHYSESCVEADLRVRLNLWGDSRISTLKGFSSIVVHPMDPEDLNLETRIIELTEHLMRGAETMKKIAMFLFGQKISEIFTLTKAYVFHYLRL